jgi:hypothetical protein
MFSVSPEVYKALFTAAHYLFAFFSLMLLLFALSWLYDERRKRRERFRSLPEAGNIGEMVVVSGSDQLPVDTWFPVPREGILGSLRSCDLVVPAPGIHARHLSFTWLDGTGLIIKPFKGCETFVDGVSLITAEKSEMPVMVHGSCLQVGSIVLRLQLLSALEHTNRPFAVTAPSQEYSGRIAAQQPLPYPPFPPEPDFPGIAGPIQDNMPRSYPADQASAAFPSVPVPEEQPPLPPAAPRRKRAERWKEDFSE